MQVMVIDDSPTIRKIIETALGREGHQVSSFPDGVEAMRYLTTSPQAQPPELIFLDIDLPKMDGFAVARHLKAKHAFAAIPIVMISRHCGIMERLKSRLVGATGFVAKPVTTQQLVKAVREVTHAHA